MIESANWELYANQGWVSQSDLQGKEGKRRMRVELRGESSHSRRVLPVSVYARAVGLSSGDYHNWKLEVVMMRVTVHDGTALVVTYSP